MGRFWFTPEPSLQNREESWVIVSTSAISRSTPTATLFAPRSRQFGEVTDVHVVSDRETGQSRGFGFVTMGSAAEAAKAIAEMNGALLDGRPLRVNEAEERQNRGGGGGGGGVGTAAAAVAAAGVAGRRERY